MRLVVDAIYRAGYGAFCSLWVPPAAVFIFTIASVVGHSSFVRSEPLWEFALKLFVVGIGFAGLGFFVGVLGLVAVGVPALFALTLLRANHPLVVCVVAGAFTYWRISAAQSYEKEETLLFLGVADLTAIIAAFYARSNPSFKADGFAAG